MRGEFCWVARFCQCRRKHLLLLCMLPRSRALGLGSVALGARCAARPAALMMMMMQARHS